MEFFIWEERLDTGIGVIDEQHQRIAQYINDLHAAIERRDEGLEADTLIQLLDYTQSHLMFEEELLDAAGYPELQDHKAKHRHFQRRINYYFKHHNEGKAIATPLISELKMWLTTHILHEDHEYIPYIERYLQGSEELVGSSG
jgi:hemerythrin